ncbi:MAG: HDOD domain-containing protein [Kiritimatiellae bacterium]|nr:HDOD domain-containing protein [Kiritimatiellia bacterium]
MNQKPTTSLIIPPELAEYYGRRIRLSVQQFPGMPIFVSQLFNELKQEETDMRVLSEQLRVDPGITVNLLRLANSARFGASREIKSVHEAVVRLGVRRTTEILLAFHVAGHFSHPLKGYDLSASELMKHSLWAALAAEKICTEIPDAPSPEYAFTAALLHDIGKVILSDFVMEEQPAIVQLVQHEKYSFDEAEKRVLGWTHAETGSAILNHWNFPDLLIQVARYHHDPGQAPEEYRMLAGIVHVADFLAYCQGPGAGVDGFSYHFREAVLERLPLNKSVVERIAGETLEQVEAFNAALGL